MASIVEDMLKSAENLPPADLEKLVTGVLRLKSTRIHAIPQNESHLLLKINHPFPADLSQRYEALLRKQRKGLSEAERKELLEINNRVENLEAEKVQNLAQLAAIRGIDIDELIEEMSLPKRTYG